VMLEGTINDMETMNSNAEFDMDQDLLEQSTALTEEQLIQYAELNPFIIYSDSGKLSVAIIEGVKSSPKTDPNPIKIRKQGVRKGVRGYNAKATTTARKLVPVFALVEEDLIDAMLISPAALALGKAALNVGSNTNRDLVDTLVEEYEESAPIERQFFPRQEDVDYYADWPTAIGVHAAPVTPASTGWTGKYVMLQDSGVNVNSIGEAVTTGYIGQPTGPAAATDVASAEWAGKAVPPTSGTIETFYNPTSLEAGDVLTATACGTPLDSADVVVVSLEPGIVADGQLLDFDPEVHVIPQ